MLYADRFNLNLSVFLHDVLNSKKKSDILFVKIFKIVL
jgi:hypothetical protein